jgi:hypothetical protein
LDAIDDTHRYADPQIDLSEHALPSPPRRLRIGPACFGEKTNGVIELSVDPVDLLGQTEFCIEVFHGFLEVLDKDVVLDIVDREILVSGYVS